MKSINVTYCMDCIHYSDLGCRGELLSKDKTADCEICQKKISKVILGEQTWLYRASEDEKSRYVLGVIGKRPLICFGINPSTARPGETDQTIRSVSRIASKNGYDSWIMLNIYPQRKTNPNDMDEIINRELYEKNLFYINEILEIYKPSELWAAWGNLIQKRKFLINCYEEISKLVNKHNCKWIRFGELNKSGNPHHPLMLRTNSAKHSFNLDSVKPSNGLVED